MGSAPETPPTRPSPFECTEHEVSGTARGLRTSSRETAEKTLDSALQRMCIVTKSAAYTVISRECREERKRVPTVVAGKMTWTDRVDHVCEAQFRCTNPREECKRRPDAPSNVGGTRQ